MNVSVLYPNSEHPQSTLVDWEILDCQVSLTETKCARPGKVRLMSKHAAYSYVEIDDADMERTHLWVTVNGVDGEMIELIEHYPVEQRESAYAMARRLAGLLDLPLKLRKDRDKEPHLLDR